MTAALSRNVLAACSASTRNLISMPFAPRPHQRDAHNKRKRFSVLVWHRRAGKTVFAIVELLLAALQCTRERGHYAYVGPYLNQTKSIVWSYLRDYTAGIPGCVYNESELSVTLPNGARVRLFGADNAHALRGLYFDGIILDEVADMRPFVWGEVVRPALMDRNGWAIFVGTPKGMNLFSDVYFKALEHPDEWHADLRRASDTGAIPAAEMEKARRELTPSQWAQEMDCDFAAAVDNTLLKLSEVLEAQGRTIHESEYAYAPKVMGVDVARYGDDRSVIFARQGNVAFKPRVLRDMDLMTLAGQVAMSIEKFQPDAVFIDQGGLGAGVVDRLRQLGHNVIGVDFGGRALDPRFENKRVEMWWGMADWVKSGGCLPEVKELAGELATPKFNYANARGKLQLESKDELRKRGMRSPDIADGLALTFAAPVAPRLHGVQGMKPGARVATSFDAYE